MDMKVCDAGSALKQHRWRSHLWWHPCTNINSDLNPLSTRVMWLIFYETRHQLGAYESVWELELYQFHDYEDYKCPYYPANTKYLYNIYTASTTHHCINVIQMFLCLLWMAYIEYNSIKRKRTNPYKWLHYGALFDIIYVCVMWWNKNGKFGFNCNKWPSIKIQKCKTVQRLIYITYETNVFCIQ